ncbi:MAG: alpha/beta fold hydrolase [Actinomycetes bacterium]
MAHLERDGVSIFYQVVGADSGLPPLLLTHGYGASTAMWEANLPTLGANRPVITWDVRGHGRSGSPDDPSRYSEAACVADLTAILDACGVDRAIVGGLSLGGYLSLAFYLADPARVAALVLCDTGPGFKRDDGRERWNTYAIGRADALDRQGVAALSDSPEVRAADHDPRGLAHAARGILTQHDARVINALPSIAVPTLVLVGANDEAFLAAADYMAAKIPGAAKAVIPDAGHAANIDKPQLFDQAVVDFLQPIS